MNFIEFWNNRKTSKLTEYEKAEKAWETCREEILKVIYKQKFYSMPDDEFGNIYLDREDLIYEINKKL